MPQGWPQPPGTNCVRLRTFIPRGIDFSKTSSYYHGRRTRPYIPLSLNSSLYRLREGAMHEYVAIGPENLYLRHRVPLSLNSSLPRLRVSAMHEHGM